MLLQNAPRQRAHNRCSSIYSSTPSSQPTERSMARFHPCQRFSRSASGIEGVKSRVPAVLTSASVSGSLMFQPCKRIAEPARSAEPSAVDLHTHEIESVHHDITGFHRGKERSKGERTLASRGG